jgi:hypothetical protein
MPQSVQPSVFGAGGKRYCSTTCVQQSTTKNNNRRVSSQKLTIVFEMIQPELVLAFGGALPAALALAITSDSDRETSVGTAVGCVCEEVGAAFGGVADIVEAYAAAEMGFRAD